MAQPWNDDSAYAPNEIDAWIAIDPDDSILIRYQRSEMGQGSMTALPMIITEELQCDWSKVRIEYASPNRNVRENKVYGDMFSNGSRSVRASQKKMQQVGASARERLIAAAAAQLERAGIRMHGRIERGHARAVGPHAALMANSRPTRRRSSSTRSRRSRRRTSSPSSASRCRASTWSHKIDGSAKFGIDAQVPDMVFAAITACPVPGGKLKSVDESPVAGAPGVLQVVKLDERRGGRRDRQLLARQAGARAAAARMGCRRGRQRRQRAAVEGVPRRRSAGRC